MQEKFVLFFCLYRNFNFFWFLGSPSPYRSSLSFTTQRGWNSLPVHQFTTCVLPFNISHPLPSPPSTPFALSNSGMCLGCRDDRNVRESVMIVIVPRGGVHESFQGHRASLGWLTECQLPPPNQPAWGPLRYLTQRSAQIWPALISAVDATCWPAYITPAIATALSAFLYLSFTHTHTF